MEPMVTRCAALRTAQLLNTRAHWWWSHAPEAALLPPAWPWCPSSASMVYGHKQRVQHNATNNKIAEHFTFSNTKQLAADPAQPQQNHGHGRQHGATSEQRRRLGVVVVVVVVLVIGIVYFFAAESPF